ncbi:hypothetical protein [Vibrio diazotrophicus]|uniref:hypothetical protein n=1 Tax=Vibrio diazotrophicus TaxID=685 RepID=UPI000C9E63DD|nr:hypothetical protein [Vibrio diazotrophicus]PNH95727.1 hypothetical protein C1O24_13410 [Vibrio diazotrophicus]
MPRIQIDITTIEQALNLQNIAAIKHEKMLHSPVKGSEKESAEIAAMWRDIYHKAGAAVDCFKEQFSADEVAEYMPEESC